MHIYVFFFQSGKWNFFSKFNFEKKRNELKPVLVRHECLLFMFIITKINVV